MPRPTLLWFYSSVPLVVKLRVAASLLRVIISRVAKNGRILPHSVINFRFYEKRTPAGRHVTLFSSRPKKRSGPSRSATPISVNNYLGVSSSEGQPGRPFPNFPTVASSPAKLHPQGASAGACWCCAACFIRDTRGESTRRDLLCIARAFPPDSESDSIDSSFSASGGPRSPLPYDPICLH